MCGDNDAGAYSTYGQAGQNYGTRLLWTLLLLIPVLYVNQEMVLRLGAVTGVGHARLIIERFGKVWGALEVIDLFILNGLTLVTEFIGITLAAGYLGLPKLVAVILAMPKRDPGRGVHRQLPQVRAGSRRAFCVGSLLLIPLYLVSHPSGAQMAHGFLHHPLPARRIRPDGHRHAADHRHRRHHGGAPGSCSSSSPTWSTSGSLRGSSATRRSTCGSAS